MVGYQKVLAVLTVAVFFTNVSLWAFATGRSGFPPLAFVFAFVVALIPLLLVNGRIEQFLQRPLVWWVTAYAVLTCWWFLWTPPTIDSYQVLRTRIVGCVFLLSAALLLEHPRAVAEARAAVTIAVLMSVAINMYEFFHPGTFSNVLGRAAGLYINPNISGSALVAGFVVTVGYLPSRVRAYFALAVLLGTLLTFSRGALVAASAALTALLFARTVSVKRLSAAFAIGVFTVTSMLVVGGGDRLATTVTASAAQFTRLGLGQDRLAPGDELATTLRREVAERSWNTFLEHPILGMGTGATGDSTHNMYLMLGAEHGILGLLLFPMLALAIICSDRSPTRATSWAFAIFALTWGLFSHNVLQDFSFLFCLALSTRPIIPSPVGASDRQHARHGSTVLS